MANNVLLIDLRPDIPVVAPVDYNDDAPYTPPSMGGDEGPDEDDDTLSNNGITPLPTPLHTEALYAENVRLTQKTSEQEAFISKLVSSLQTRPPVYVLIYVDPVTYQATWFAADGFGDDQFGPEHRYRLSQSLLETLPIIDNGARQITTDAMREMTNVFVEEADAEAPASLVPASR